MKDLINKITCDDCLSFVKIIEDDSIDMVLTSPPYDNLRNYKTNNQNTQNNRDERNNQNNQEIGNNQNNNQPSFNFEIFKEIARELYRILKKGGVIVWIVNDSIIDKSESGTSFRQALYFKDVIGFKLYDTMIYEKNGLSSSPDKTRYHQKFEYMFILSKDTKPKTFNPLMDRKNKWHGSWGIVTHRDKNGNLTGKRKIICKEYGKRFNIWKYNTGKYQSSKDIIAFQHPAIFPEELAKDIILSYSNENDIILDPFMGSGTTAKMCLLLNRNFIGCDISKEYCEIANERLKETKEKMQKKKEETLRKQKEKEIEPSLFF